MTPASKWATLAVRTCGLFVTAPATWQMLGNIAGTYRDIDPSYLGYFFSSQLARPLCGIIVGLLLFIFSRPLGRLIAHGLDK